MGRRRYLGLAEGGYAYPNISPYGGARASNFAYFPLFPWLVRRIEHTGLLSLSQALVVVSWLGGLLRRGRSSPSATPCTAAGRHRAVRSVGHGAGLARPDHGYPEGMFTAAAAAALLCLIRRRPVWAGACAARRRPAAPFRRGGDRDGGVYFLVEFGRWLALRRSQSDDWSARPRHAGSVPRRNAAELGPVRAFLGAVVSTLGLGGFMIYVGVRTGEVFGYFAVQGERGQETAGFTEYLERIRKCCSAPSRGHSSR